MENIRLSLEYDGTNFSGWQIQTNGLSIQGELEKALKQILQKQIPTVAAGRTDAGVHARGQVVSFKVPGDVDLPLLTRGLNALLPPDIVVLSGEKVHSGFNARHDARGRVYRYYLQLRPTALMREYCWYVGGYEIATDLLKECAETIVGEHDFSSFCKTGTTAGHFRCLVEKAQWTNEGSMLIFEIRANRFLYGMVRALVGTMVEIARGHRPIDDFQSILDAKDRSRAGMSAPAKGLFLEEVIY